MCEEEDNAAADCVAYVIMEKNLVLLFCRYRLHADYFTDMKEQAGRD